MIGDATRLGCSITENTYETDIRPVRHAEHHDAAIRSR